MKRFHGRAALGAAALATVLAVAGATAAQGTSTGTSPDGVAAAKSQVMHHSNRFGFGPGQALISRAVYKDRTGSAIRFDRTYRGLPVIGGDFIVHLTPAGAFRYGNGMRISGLPASLTAKVSASAAGAVAVKAVRYAVASTSTKLVVFGGQHASPLAWQINIKGTSGVNGTVTYVSATTGRILARWSTVDTAQDVGKGKTEYSGTVRVNDLTNGTTYTLQDNKRGKQQIYNANHSQQHGSGTIFTDTNNVWGDHLESNVETPAADAAYGIAKTWDFYLNTFGRNGIGDDGIAARGFVHYGTNYVNAFWADDCFCMSFGDGSQGSGISPLDSLDVSGHEMTHGVTSRTAGLIYAGESGGLNESTSDVLGTMVEWYANNTHDVPDYVIGEEIFRDYDPATNFIRRMDKPSLDGNSKDCWYDGIGGLNVHYSSGVGNHAFYLLSEGSGPKTINGIDYDSPTCDGSIITGIGRDKAAAIWYKALTEQWTSNTNYHDARIGLLNAARDLYGKTSVERKTVNKVLAAVNVTP
jgi:Zn-dependent metalloprotease